MCYFLSATLAEKEATKTAALNQMEITRVAFTPAVNGHPWVTMASCIRYSHSRSNLLHEASDSHYDTDDFLRL